MTPAIPIENLQYLRPINRDGSYNKQRRPLFIREIHGGRIYGPRRRLVALRYLAHVRRR